MVAAVPGWADVKKAWFSTACSWVLPILESCLGSGVLSKHGLLRMCRTGLRGLRTPEESLAHDWRTPVPQTSEPPVLGRRDEAVRSVTARRPPEATLQPTEPPAQARHAPPTRPLRSARAG